MHRLIQYTRDYVITFAKNAAFTTLPGNHI